MLPSSDFPSAVLNLIATIEIQGYGLRSQQSLQLVNVQTKLFLAKIERVTKYFWFAQLTVRIDGAPAASGGGVYRKLCPELPRFISFAPLRACPLACFSAHPKKLLF